MPSLINKGNKGAQREFHISLLRLWPYGRTEGLASRSIGAKRKLDEMEANAIEAGDDQRLTRAKRLRTT